jgi:hypothetical protein
VSAPPEGAGGAAPLPPPAPGEAQAEAAKPHLCILFTVETEYDRHEEFVQVNGVAKLQNISLLGPNKGKPAFHVVEMLNTREVWRNGLGEESKSGEGGRPPEGEKKEGGTFEAARLARLKGQWKRYLIVPVWCVVNSQDDYGTLPDQDKIDQVVKEIKEKSPAPLPTWSRVPQQPVGQKEAGNAVVQIRNKSDVPIMVYFSGAQSRAFRVPGGDKLQEKPGLWHAILKAGEYDVAMTPEQAAGPAPSAGTPPAKGAAMGAGPAPCYGQLKCEAGVAISLEFSGAAGTP